MGREVRERAHVTGGRRGTSAAAKGARASRGRRHGGGGFGGDAGEGQGWLGPMLCGCPALARVSMCVRSSPWREESPSRDRPDHGEWTERQERQNQSTHVPSPGQQGRGRAIFWAPVLGAVGSGASNARKFGPDAPVGFKRRAECVEGGKREEGLGDGRRTRGGGEDE